MTLTPVYYDSLGMSGANGIHVSPPIADPNDVQIITAQIHSLAPIEWSLVGPDLGLTYLGDGDDGNDNYWVKYRVGNRAGETRVRATVTGEECLYGEAPIKVGCASCPDSQCTAGSGKANITQSLNVELSLGSGLDGKSAGYLWLHATEATPMISAVGGLAVEGRTEDTQVYSPDGVLSEVRSAQCLAKVIDTNPEDWTYEIQFFGKSQIAPADWDVTGPWPTTGDPYTTWVITQPNAPTDFRTVQVEKIVNSAVEVTYIYTYSESLPGGPDWSLEIDDGSSQPRSEVEEWADLGSGIWSKTLTETRDGGAVSVTVEKWKHFSWGRAITEKSVYLDGSSALTTTYAYHGSTGDAEGRLWRQVNSDGSWVVYRYDGQGRLRAEIRGDQDTAAPASNTVDVNSSGTRSIEYSYWASGANYIDTTNDTGASGQAKTLSDQPRLIVERIGSVEVGRTMNGYWQYPATGTPDYITHIQKRCVDVGATYAAGTNLVTQTDYAVEYDSELEKYRPKLERPLRILRPAGAYDKFTYVAGTWTNSDRSFTAGAGNALQTTVEHGYHAPGASTLLLKTNVSTKEIITADEAGRVVHSETFPYVSGNYSSTVISETENHYDDLGRLEQQDLSNGTRSTTEWDDCCGSNTHTGIDGQVTQTAKDPELHRVTQINRPAYNGQAELTTTFTYGYDATNFWTTVTASLSHGGSGVTPIKTTDKYDRAGRLVQQIAQDTGNATVMLVTNYAYTNDGRTVTVTHPGGAQEITDHFVDGRVKSITGDAVIAQYYSYSVASGSQTTTIKTGASDSDREQVVTVDMLGRESSRSVPAYPSGTNTTTYTYRSPTEKGSGNIKKVAPPSGSPKSPTLYEYDDFGVLFREALDVTSSPADEITPNSMDRIIETESTYQLISSTDWWRVATVKTYPTANNATSKTLSTQRERLTGFTYSSSGNIAYELQSLDIRNNVTTTTRTINGSNREVLETTDPPDAAPSVSSSIDGLLQSMVSQTGSELTFTYDHFRRRLRTTGPRAAVWEQSNYEAGTHRLSSVQHSDESGGSSITTQGYAYYAGDAGTPNAGRVKYIENANTTTGRTYFSYTSRGDVEKTWGHVPQPTRIEYDDFGQRFKLHTYRTTPSGGWGADTWPGDTVDDDVTEWSFDEATGLLESKLFADNTSVIYGYTAEGRIQTRTWARDSGTLTTTYHYSGENGGEPKTAELKSIDYPSGTTDVVFTYLRSGLLDTVQDAANTRTFTYTTDLEPNQEKLGGFYSTSTKWITHTYASNAPGRLTQLQVGTSGSPGADYSAAYTYDGTTARMSRVTGPGLPSTGSVYGAYYTYENTSGVISDLVTKIEITNNGTVRCQTERMYESGRDLLDFVKNVWKIGGTSDISKYDYSNSNLALRTQCAYSGSAFSSVTDAVAYNTRNEVSDVTRGSQIWSYTYDPIGNRLTYVDDPPTGTTRTTEYQSNAVNQYPSSELTPTPHTSQGYSYDDDGNLIEMFVAGDMNCDGQLNSGDETAFLLALSDREDYETAYPACEWLNGDLDGDGDVNFNDLSIFSDILGAGTATATRLTYEWDAENRLTKVTPYVSGASVNATKCEFTYDYMGRRIEKKVWTWNGSAWSSSPTLHRKYVWDGWLLIEELNGASSNAVVKKYTWGLDLAGLNGSVNDRTSAGGIGGLLAIHIVGASVANLCYSYDGNGNVGQLIDWANTGTGSAATKAKYEYDPYGNRSNTGSGEPENDFKFSTKMLDAESGLYYYGYRYYAPKLGRWINRDPISESGGSVGLYQFNYNDAQRWIDPDGRRPQEPEFSKAATQAYWDQWKKDHPNLTEAEYTKWKEKLNEGCYGVVCLRLGIKTPLQHPSTLYCTDSRSNTMAWVKELSKQPCCKPVLFSIKFWSDSSKRDYREQGWWEKDGRPQRQLTWDPTKKRHREYFNFDYAYWDGEGWVGADRGGEGMLVKRVPTEIWETAHIGTDENAMFNRVRYCASCDSPEAQAASRHPGDTIAERRTKELREKYGGYSE